MTDGPYETEEDLEQEPALLDLPDNDPDETMEYDPPDEVQDLDGGEDPAENKWSEDDDVESSPDDAGYDSDEEG